MGNAGSGNAAPVAYPSPPRQPASRVPLFEIRSLGHTILNRGVAYNFLVGPPRQDGFSDLPGHVISKTFEDFQELDAAMALRYQEATPELPASTFFHHTDADFLAQRARGLERYLRSLLLLECMPRTKVLRRFLGISQPLPPEFAMEGTDAPLRLAGLHVPMQIAALMLSFLDPLTMLRSCSSVCRTMGKASHNSRCWPSLRFGTRCAERWLDRLFALLMPTCRHLQALSLDLRFQEPRLSVALPDGVHLPELRRLSLRLRDAEAVSLGVEILGSVEAPRLQRVAVAGGELTMGLVRAVQAVCIAAGGHVHSLRLSWAPERIGPLSLSTELALAVRELLESVPSVQELEVGTPEWMRTSGISRSMAEPLRADMQADHIPGLLPFLLDASALSHLRRLSFDFLSLGTLQGLTGLRPRSWNLQRVRISGPYRQVRDPDEALFTILSKAGEGLEVLEIMIDMEAELRPFMKDQLHTRIGALPNLWQERAALRSLSLNWTAFDDDGVGCIAEHCRQLHTLRLDRTEYWSDAAVAHVAERLENLQHFRLRASAVLSDRALYSLMDVAYRFVTLELEPSYCMSRFAIKQLGGRLASGAEAVPLEGQQAEAGAWGTSVEELLAFAAGLDQGAREELLRGMGRSSSASLQLLPPSDQSDGTEDMLHTWNRIQQQDLGPAMELGW